MQTWLTRSCFLEETQRNMKKPFYSEAQTGIVCFKSAQWEGHGVICDACLPYLERLRNTFEGFKEENNRLKLQLRSVFGWMRFAEMAGISPDEAMAVAGCLSLCGSTVQVPAEKDPLLPEAFHDQEDSHLAVISTTLSEQIARTEKEWKILAGMYNELVERILQSEKMLSDVRSRNSQLEIMNAELLSLMLHKQSSSKELQSFPSLNQMMHQDSSTKSNLQRPVVPMPAECMDGKSPSFSREICKGSVYSSPICMSEQQMGIACEVNNCGSVRASPVSVLEQSVDSEYIEDSVGLAYKSPTYTSRDRTRGIKSGEEVAEFAHARGGVDEHWRPDLVHALMAMPLAGEIQSLDEAVLTKSIPALFCERDEFPVGALASERGARMPLTERHCSNSVVMASRCQRTSIFDASLHLSEKQRCSEWSSRYNLADHAPDLHPSSQHAFPHSSHKHYSPCVGGFH